jgi:hypothetical protein
VKSRRPPAFADHATALGQALVEVAENSFFVFVSECDDDLFNEIASSAADGQQQDWIVADIAFAGAYAGRLTMRMPTTLARSLLGAFTGLEAGAPVPEASLPDAAGEFANMVCGAWLTRTCQRRRFDLSPPRVERMSAGWRPPAFQPDGPQAGQIGRLVGDLPLRIELSFDQAWA